MTISRLLLFIAAPILGLMVGAALGGRLRALLAWRLRWTWLLVLACVLQFLLRLGPLRPVAGGLAGLALTGLAFALAGAWMAGNLPDRSRPVQMGLLAALLGGGLNGLAIAANGQMPVSLSAAHDARVVDALAANPHYLLATKDTLFVGLGDVIAVPALHQVVSVGDLLIMLGIALAVAGQMLSTADHGRFGARKHDLER